MYGNSIEDIRKDAFKYTKKHDKEYIQNLSKSLKVIYPELPNKVIGNICLDVFEFILYSYFSSTSIVTTKCDIDRMLISSRNKYAGKAKTLLNCIYSIRNGFAHSDLRLDNYINSLKAFMSEIQNKTEFVQILRLIIQVSLPRYIDNLYYVVEREDENVELSCIDNAITACLYDFSLNRNDRLVGSIQQKLKDDYVLDILNDRIVFNLFDSYVVETNS